MLNRNVSTHGDVAVTREATPTWRILLSMLGALALILMIAPPAPALTTTAVAKPGFTVKSIEERPLTEYQAGSGLPANYVIDVLYTGETVPLSNIRLSLPGAVLSPASEEVEGFGSPLYDFDPNASARTFGNTIYPMSNDSAAYGEEDGSLLYELNEGYQIHDGQWVRFFVSGDGIDSQVAPGSLSVTQAGVESEVKESTIDAPAEKIESTAPARARSIQAFAAEPSCPTPILGKMTDVEGEYYAVTVPVINSGGVSELTLVNQSALKSSTSTSTPNFLFDKQYIGDWRIETGGRSYTGGVDFVVQTAPGYPAKQEGVANAVTLKFQEPIHVAAGSFRLFYKLLGVPTSREIGSAVSGGSISATCSGDYVPPVGPTDPDQPTEPTRDWDSSRTDYKPGEKQDTLPAAPTPGPNEAVIRQYARAFFYKPGPDAEGADPTQEQDLRMTKGAQFQLFTGNRGPEAPVTAPWGTATVGDGGFADFRIPAEGLGQQYWVKQIKGADRFADVPGDPYYANQIKTGDYQSPKDITYTIGQTPRVQGGKVYNASEQGNDKDRSFGAAVQAVPNPPIPATCNPGPRIGIVMDMSASISSDEMRTYQQALTGDGGLLDKLKGTNASISAFTFSWGSPSEDNERIGNYPGLVNLDTNMAEAKRIVNDRMNRGGRTNWNDGLTKAYEAGQQINNPRLPYGTGYDIVLFVTDGNPNTTGPNRYRPDGNDVSLRALEGGAYAANLLKFSGTRVMAIAAGGPGQNTPENLVLVSGPKENEDYYNGSWEQLSKNLVDSVRGSVCESNVVINKQIVRVLGQDGKDASATDLHASTNTVIPVGPGAGWDFTAALDNTKNGTINLVSGSERGAKFTSKTSSGGQVKWGVNYKTDNVYETADITVNETAQENFDFYQAKCTKKTFDGRKLGEKTITDPAKFNLPQLGRLQTWECDVQNRQRTPETPTDNYAYEMYKQVKDYKQRPDGKWEIVYEIVVWNTGTNEFRYQLTDTLDFGAGIVPESAKWTLTTTGTFDPTRSWGPAGGTWQNLPADRTAELHKERPIRKGVRDTFTVTVVADLLGTNGAKPSGMECKAGTDGPQAGGFLNTAHVKSTNRSSQLPEKDSSACAEPAVPEVIKQEVGTSGPDANGVYTAEYTVAVRNTSNVTGPNGTKVDKPLYYWLEDTPRFPQGVTITGWNVVGDNVANFQEKSSTQGTTPIKIVPSDKPRQIQPGVMEKYNVKVKYKLPADPKNALQGKTECGADGSGLNNTARMHSGSQYRDDDACLPIRIPEDRIELEKLDPDYKGIPGAGFAMQFYDAQGNTIGDTVFSTPVYDELRRGDTASNGPSNAGGNDYPTSRSTIAVPGNAAKLVIVEINSPEGYSLLAAPVQVDITRGNDGKAILKVPGQDTQDQKFWVAKAGEQQHTRFVRDGNGDVIYENGQPKRENYKIQTVQVTDSTKGDMPASGGSGVMWILGAGLVSLAAAAAAQRKKLAI